MSLLAGRTLVVVDTETTGFDVLRGHEIVEVASITIADGTGLTEWSSLVRPRRSIPIDASAVHGITDAMIATAPSSAEVAAQLRERCADHVLAFHNATFDLPFLRAFFRGAGQPPLLAPVLDTLGLARGLFGAGGNSLAELTLRLGLPLETGHRALADARTTVRAMLRLIERWEREHQAQSLEELAAASLDQVRLTRSAKPESARLAAPTPSKPSPPPQPDLFAPPDETAASPPSPRDLTALARSE